MKHRTLLARTGLALALVVGGAACRDDDKGGTLIPGGDAAGDTSGGEDASGGGDAGTADTGTTDVGSTDTGTSNDVGGSDASIPDAGGADAAEDASAGDATDIGGDDVPGVDITGDDVALPDVTGDDVAGPDVQGPDVAGEDVATPDDTAVDVGGPDVAEEDTGGAPDTGTGPTCATIAELKATPEGPVDLTLCGVTVTYVFGAGYFVQQGPAGPATLVFVGTGNWTYTPPVAGDVLDIPVTEYGSFSGQQEITGHEAPTSKGKKSLVGWALPIDDGFVAAELVESMLVAGNDLVVTKVAGKTFWLDHGGVADTQMFADNAPGSLCVGAVLDVFQAAITEFNGVYQIRVYDGAVDLGNVDVSGCGAEPVYDDSNWGFEDWTQSDPPAGFIKLTDKFTATKETGSVHGGAAAAKLTWTSTSNQDFMAGMFVPVVPGMDATISLWMRDNDPNGRARLALTFYTASKVALSPNEFSTTFTSDSAAWANYSFTKAAPANAAFVRGFVRLYDENDFATAGSATVLIDDLTISP